SRGGAPIWVMREAWMPKGVTPQRVERLRARQAAGESLCAFELWEIAAIEGLASADPDGFAVFGRYPKGFLDHVLKQRLLGEVRRDQILHVCSGTLGPEERWTVDIRPDAKPRVIADGSKLPFKEHSFAAVMIDPPYSDQYARNLYGTDNPRPSWLLREAARVVMANGRIGLLHIAVPFAPPYCHLVTVYGVSTGVGFRIRAFTVWQKEQARLFEDDAPLLNRQR
ncbi:MAG: hypothetical protein ACE5JS_23625, partial [Nitrospinota bacterium]